MDFGHIFIPNIIDYGFSPNFHPNIIDYGFSPNFHRNLEFHHIFIQVL